MSLKIKAAFLAMALSGQVWAQPPMPPGVQSPIGSPTVPPSAGRTGAIPSPPDFYGSYGNSVVTGTIGGGKHFRGVVPYGSTFYTDSRLIDQGSAAVSNFLRYSAGNEPFYDPLRTTTTLRRGTVSGLQPPVVAPQGRAGSTAASRQWLESFDVIRVLSPAERRPIETSAESMQKMLEQQISPDLLRQEQKREQQEFETTAVVPRELLPSSLQLPTIPQPQELPEPAKPLEPGTGLIEEIPAAKKTERPAENVYDQLRQKLSEQPEQEMILEEEEEPQPKTQEQEKEEAIEEFSRLVRPEDTLAREEGRRTLRDYPDYLTMASQKFEDYLAAGQAYLQQGQYYKAADAFELASVWKPGDALVVLARSHALFAAGEYMSSSLYLHRALLMDRRLAGARVDLSALIGDKDVFENRLIELSTWQQRSNSGEMAFLAAYVLLQDDKVSRAREMILAAEDTLRNAPALEILTEAVRQAPER